MTTKEDLERAIGYLRAARRNLSDARVHVDEAYFEGSVHFNDVTEMAQKIDKWMIDLSNRLGKL